MRPNDPLVHAAGIALSWIALPVLLFLGSSNSASRAIPRAPDGLNPGPDVILGDITSLGQFGSNGTRVGLAMVTDTCNSGNQQLNVFALPNTDHPVLAQNLYRIRTGSDGAERFEQVGQSWVVHAFSALQANDCGFGCTPASDGTHLGAGCSTADSGSINASPTNLGSRAWVNPFTGLFPSTANNHAGHTHTGTSHRILVEGSDLDTTMNSGAIYYAEGQLVTPHEYAWCQAHPGECNMYNNASYRRFNVSGTTIFNFSPVGSTVRMSPAINAWPGATIRTIEPAPGIDGRAFLAYKVTGPVDGLYHYEYAIYNQNLDRGIQSFRVPMELLPVGSETTIGPRNIEFHAPPQHPGFSADGTQGDAGFSGAEWSYTLDGVNLTWSTETLAQNPNANAIRWGTLYNFRFDTNAAPQAADATVGFFKTGAPITVPIQGPRPVGGPAPTPTPTPPITVSLMPLKDNTLYQDPNGALSNGAGIYFFDGKTGTGLLRRGLIAFDLTSIPSSATITAATLSMFLSQANGGSQAVSLSMVSRDWGEGASDAGDPGGTGAPAQPGDATWLHTFYNTSFWMNVGGDFSPTASATTAVSALNTTYTWSGAGLIADVQAWVSDPASNFGWVVRGNESTTGVAQRFNSRENSSNPPLLTVTFLPPTPTPTPTPLPPTLNISGTIPYCSNPVPGPVPNASLHLTGDATASVTTDGSGNYQFTGVPTGGHYIVTPSKTALPPGSAGINTVDVIAVQRSFLNIVLLSGCPLAAADVNGDGSVNTIDVIAIQRFFLSLSTGIANVGKYSFGPATRSYPGLVSDQTGQDYDALIFGDVASPFAQ